MPTLAERALVPLSILAPSDCASPIAPFARGPPAPPVSVVPAHARGSAFTSKLRVSLKARPSPDCLASYGPVFALYERRRSAFDPPSKPLRKALPSFAVARSPLPPRAPRDALRPSGWRFAFSTHELWTDLPSNLYESVRFKISLSTPPCEAAAPEDGGRSPKATTSSRWRNHSPEARLAIPPL